MSLFQQISDKVSDSPVGKLGDKFGRGIGRYAEDPAKATGVVSGFKPRQYDVKEAGFTDTELKKRREAEFASALKEVNQRQIGSPYQDALARQMFAQTTGQAPSLAQEQLKQATDRNIAQQMAMAQSGRGQNMAQALRSAQMQGAQAQQGMAADSAQLRLSEQLAAQQGLASLSGQQVQQQLANRAQQDAMRQFYTQGQLGLDQDQLNRLMMLEQLRAQQSMGIQGLQQATSAQNAQSRANILTGLAQAGAQAASGGGAG